MYNLEEYLDYPLIMLKQTDAGEKAAALYQMLFSDEQQVLWYNLDYLDNEELIFLRYLQDAFKMKLPSLQFNEQQNEGNLVVPFCYLKKMELLISEVTEYIAEHDETMYCLVLDNFQEIENKIIFRMLRQLIENIPKGLKLILISDEDVPDFLIKYICDGRGCLVDTEKLQRETSGIGAGEPFYVTFFGNFRAGNLKTGEDVCWRTRKEKQLFAYLFSLNGRMVDRANLLDTLWHDEIPENAVPMLHNMLYHIRKELNRLGQDNLICCEKKNIQ